ncbi:MAG TPA: hypothetical protein ENG94_08125 [Actinobacteria bacterium]|nr:hypothetical protein [Actinomycetota bacterium]
MLQQMLRAARLDRRVYTELIFDDYATGNAIMVVAGVYALIALASAFSGIPGISLTGVLLVLFGGVIGWLVIGGALWMAGVKLLDGEARFQTVVRLVGFAHTPLIIVAIALPLPSPVSTAVAIVALVWFFAAVTAAAQVLFDFERGRSASAALLAVAVWWVLQMIGIGPSLPMVFRRL